MACSRSASRIEMRMLYAYFVAPSRDFQTYKDLGRDLGVGRAQSVG